MTWYLLSSHGQRFGPIPDSELQKWFQAGRITAGDFIYRSGATDWQPAEAIFPTLNCVEPPPIADREAAKKPTNEFLIDTNVSRAGSIETHAGTGFERVVGFFAGLLMVIFGSMMLIHYARENNPSQYVCYVVIGKGLFLIVGSLS